MILKTENLKLIEVRSSDKMEFIDITGRIINYVNEVDVESGILIIYTPHTTAGITVNENADPSVKSDMIRYFSETVPDKSYFSHMEGNSPSHIMSSIISPSQTFIISGGKIILGTWQGIFFCEFDGPRNRKVYLKVQRDFV